MMLYNAQHPRVIPSVINIYRTKYKYYMEGKIMLIEVTLSKDGELGNAGDTVLINNYYIVAVGNNKGKAVFYLDLSDLDKFYKVYTKDSYEKWYALRLNP